MRIAAAAYPLSPNTDWDGHVQKLEAWVAEAANGGAELLVFPEYGRMELAALDGLEAAGALETSLQAAMAWFERSDQVMAALAAKHGLYVLAGSGPAQADGPRPVNRASFFGPEGLIGHQDKQIMTRFEREVWDVVSGGPLQVFDTKIGRIGVLICYDAEFPALGRALVEAGAEIILVPSCTDSLAGYSRVRIGAMARALEGQCVVVHAPTVGDAAWSPAVDENLGAAAIYGPPDLGFPPNGILAEGALNAAGWVFADIDRDAIAKVRRDGGVLNHANWPESVKRAQDLPRRAVLP